MLLSGGRFTLGVGLGGGRQAEFAAFGEEADPRVRAELLDEGTGHPRRPLVGRAVQLRRHAPHRISGAQFTPPLGAAAARAALGRGPLAQPPPVPAGGAVGRRVPGLRGRGLRGEMAAPAATGRGREPTRAPSGPTHSAPFDVALECVSAGEDRAADAARAEAYATTRA